MGQETRWQRPRIEQRERPWSEQRERPWSEQRETRHLGVKQKKRYKNR